MRVSFSQNHISSAIFPLPLTPSLQGREEEEGKKLKAKKQRPLVGKAPPVNLEKQRWGKTSQRRGDLAFLSLRKTKKQIRYAKNLGLPRKRNHELAMTPCPITPERFYHPLSSPLNVSIRGPQYLKPLDSPPPRHPGNF